MLKINEEDLRKYSYKQSVLIVDDEELIITMLERKLKRYFKRVDTAANGKEAIDKCKNYNFDLIISDIKMPVMNGIMFLKEIRKKDLNKRVIFMSAYDENEYFIELLNNGADGFLLKPNTEEQLLYLLYKNCKVIHQEKLNQALYKELDEKNTKLTKINLKFKKLYHKLIEKIKNDIDELINTNELAKEDLEIINLDIDKNENFFNLKDKSHDKNFEKISAKGYLEKIDFFKYNGDILEDFELIDELEFDIEGLLNREYSLELIEKIKLFLTKYLQILTMLVEFETVTETLSILNDMLNINELQEIDDIKFFTHLEQIINHLMNWRKSLFIKKDAKDIHFLDEKIINNCIEIQKILKKKKLN
jgi:CheY-like chemotaxis protein